MSNRFLLIVLACVVILGGVFFFTRDNSDSGNVDTSNGTNHTQGSGSVTLVEFGDFECPACAAYVPIVDQIKEEYGKKITFQFRHFPLIQIHPNAMLAARAAEAAGNQGKFWEMHDLLYGQQSTWSGSDNANAIFEDFATQLGLNIEQYKADAASAGTLDLINADVTIGKKLDVSATPTFVLNGERIETTPRNFEDFQKLIDEAIKDNKNN